ncbi:hypothetical protein [Lactiplantibacillus brownii]|uniref:hypothetical protein n=1 Tax=Lactiplantibacillus brownii TaxID=3069269 RepID=UPI0038B2857D
MQRKDLTDQQFGHLTAIKPDGKSTDGHTAWLCKCDCGILTHVSGANLQSGGTTSCGHVEKANRDAYHEKIRTEEPGTNLDLLGNKPSKNSELHERNISIRYSGGKKRYRVAIMYKRHQYGGLRDTMEEAIELREHLRRKYWPNYKTEK